MLEIPEVCHHVERDTVSVRKTTANIGGKGTWAANFMPRTHTIGQSVFSKFVS